MSAAKSLYERLGGRAGLTQVVDGFVRIMLADSRMNKNKQIAARSSHLSQPRCREAIVELLCERTGGPCHYEGKSLQRIHAGMDIGATEWRYMREDLGLSLDQAKVAPAERKELMDVIESTRSEIVVSDN